MPERKQKSPRALLRRWAKLYLIRTLFLLRPRVSEIDPRPFFIQGCEVLSNVHPCWDREARKRLGENASGGCSARSMSGVWNSDGTTLVSNRLCLCRQPLAAVPAHLHLLHGAARTILGLAAIAHPKTSTASLATSRPATKAPLVRQRPMCSEMMSPALIAVDKTPHTRELAVSAC